MRAVNVPRAGRYRFICYVALEKMQEGEAKLAAMAAFVADPFLKFVVVVDHDVDINNDTDVLHAIATRVRADHDTFMVPYAKGSPLDPASYDPAGGSNLVTKMGIDATRKSNYPDEIAVPGFDQINMADVHPGLPRFVRSSFAVLAPVSMPLVLVVVHARRAARRFDGVFDIDFAGLLELQRALDALALLERLLQPDEHQVIRTGL